MKIHISATISEELAQKLKKISKLEGKSKSYYVNQGLSEVLEERFRDMQDLISAKKTLKAAKDRGEELVPFEEVFKKIN